MSEYLLVFLPNCLNLFAYIFYLSILYNINRLRISFKFPHILVLILTYIIVFSYIPHKEDRFLLPVFPFIFLLISSFVLKIMKQLSWGKSFILKGFYLLILYEVIISAAFYKYNQRRSDSLEYIMNSDPNPH